MTLTDLEFGVLGPVEARDADGTPLPVPGGRPAALLALLLVRRGEVVPADVAVEALWPAGPPRHPDNALQLAASRLRQALAAGPPFAIGGGYRLDAPRSTVDADRFETLAAAGAAQLARNEAHDAAATLRQALALWRGPVLGPLRDEEFAVGFANRLDDQHLAVTLDRVAADLATGRHAELVDELSALVAAHPLRERVRGQLMLALYGAGRRADALAVYRDACRVLAGELGIEPSAELRAIEARIRRQEPVDPPAAAATPRRTAPARRRTVTCVAVEPAGAAWAAADPELRHAVTVALVDHVRAVCEPLGGTIVADAGSSPVAVFGWPRASEDDTVRATAAAFRMRCGAPLSGRATELSTGVASGEVVEPVGAPGPLVRDVATAARRLAAAPATGPAEPAGPGRVLVTGAVWAAVQRFSDGTPVAVDGTHAVRLEHFEPTTRRPPSGPLVGRTAEIRRLQRALDRVAITAYGRIALVLGDPGVGKTRLGHALAGRWRRTATVLTAGCATLPGAPAYQPVRDLLEHAAAGTDLGGWIRARGLPARVVAEASTALGLAEAGGDRPSTVQWALRQLIAAVPGTGPLVLLLDDVQAATDELVELLTGFAGVPVPRRLLVVGLGRPDAADRFPTDRRIERLTLGPLTAAQARTFVTRLAGDTLPPAARERVVASAAGNPFYIEQMVRHLAEHPGDERPLPATLRPLLAARLDRLPDPERAMLELCAVQGETFWPAACAAIAGDTAGMPVLPAARRAALDALIRRDLVVPVAEGSLGAAMRFRHPLLREAAEAGMARAWRATLHENFARWLARRPAAPPAAGAWHLEQAGAHLVAIGDPDGRADELAGESAALYRAAGRAAHGRGEVAEEIKALRRAVALRGTDRPEGAETAAALAAALLEAGDFDEANALAREAVTAAWRHDRPATAWRATVQRDHTDLLRDRAHVEVGAMLDTIAGATAHFTGAGDHEGLARTEALHAELLTMLGRPDDAMECCVRQVAHARRAGAGFEAATGLTAQAWSLLKGETPVDAALARVADLEREAAGDRVALIGLAGMRALLASLTGEDGDAAREQVARTRDALAELGLTLATATMSVLEARLDLRFGDPVRARAAAERALRISADSADRCFRATALVDLAAAVVAGGDVAEATAAVAAVDTMPAPADTEWVVRRATVRSALSTLRGAHDAAVVEADAAVRRSAPTQLLSLRCHASLALATALARAGRAEESRAAARDALALAERKQDRVLAAAVRRLLDDAAGRATAVATGSMAVAAGR